MRRVSIDNLCEGMELAKTIYTSDGNILLSAGMRLKSSYIKRLKELYITEMYIEDEISKDIFVDDIISDEIRFEARVEVRKAMDGIKLGEKLATRDVRNVINNIVEDLFYKDELMINLKDIRSNDDYLFCHSVNVCVLSVVTGISLGYNKEKLSQLGMSAILHDIGKTRVPYEVLNKIGKLTNEEFEIIKKHTTYGYDILRESDDVNAYSKIVALTHHERYDGRGYPLGISESQIHEYSKIVSIADVYDAMTSDRVYRKRLKISEAIEYLIGLSNYNFDYKLVRSFIEHITVYPIGTCILLNTKQKAIIVDINKKFPNRPIIRIVTDEAGDMLKEFIEIDLTKNNSLVIIDEIENI